MLETTSRSPHGERELKFRLATLLLGDLRRSPHGERELKWDNSKGYQRARRVAPHTGSVS